MQPLACTPVLDDLCKRSLAKDYTSPHLFQSIIAYYDRVRLEFAGD